MLASSAVTVLTFEGTQSQNDRNSQLCEFLCQSWTWHEKSRRLWRAHGNSLILEKRAIKKQRWRIIWNVTGCHFHRLCVTVFGCSSLNLLPPAGESPLQSVSSRKSSFMAFFCRHFTRTTDEGFEAAGCWDPSSRSRSGSSVLDSVLFRHSDSEPTFT